MGTVLFTCKTTNGIIPSANVKQNSRDFMVKNRFRPEIVRATQTEKGQTFRALHERAGAFLIPNPWDAGTARLLEHLGFEALATTSMGYAFSMGRRDNTLDRDETLQNAAAIASATPLPVSADLENGFGDLPEVVAETIKLAAETGIVGGSIEDATGKADDPIYDLELAIERVEAAVQAVRALPFTFTLTARAENYLHGRPNLRDTIARLQAFQDAGADVLYAPGLATREDIATVVRSVDRPVNVLMGLRGVQLTLADLSEIGVRRVSVGSALARTALAGFLKAAHEIRERGTFTFAAQAANPAEISKIFED
jgi:2-methylisocitrate lyase-like PEP mutase family enzyme